MASDVIIYHNPRCTKSRQTLDLLREKGIEPLIVEYLKTPPSEKEIATLIEKLGGSPLTLVRTNEKVYGDSDLTKRSGAAQVARAIAEHPILLQRPVVVKGNRAAVGRPPETVLEIL